MLQIRLLGQFDVRLDGKRVVISSRVGQSLLAYLALTAGTSHRREKLAGLFWPDANEEKARTYLRQELWRIRKAIPPQNLAPDQEYLIADEFTLAFNPRSDYWLDVAILERPDDDPESLTSSLSLYQGELLPGFYDEWIVLERERIHNVFESKMTQLVEKLVDLERWTAVQEQCERWLALGHASEPAYRALMISYSARGDMAKVSAAYQRCVEDLQEQFGVEPSTETHALYNGLLKGAKVPRRLTPAQPSGTVTFLFTDIEGSTLLLDKLGDQYATSLAEHHKILRAAIQKWNGREMDTQGDAFFVTFARALDAVQFAAEAQRNLTAHVWPSGETIRVRMGLHTGEPLITSTGYVGMDVHRAARIGDSGHGGQVLLSQTTRELVIHDLPEGIKIRDLGEHRLKDMKFPTPIFQLVLEGLPAEFPPLKTKFTGTEAPTPGEPPFKGLQYFDESDCDLFFGREILTAKLADRLRDSQFLSVIIGASGSGKSSLVRAGLIPALKNGGLLTEGLRPPDGSADWQVHVITPTAHPLEALATELTHQTESVTAAATLMDDLAKDPRSLALFLARKNDKQHSLLVVDQFEELFTLCRDEFEREAFIDNLLTAISPTLTISCSITLILTLRADFYAHLAQYPELRDLVAKQQEYIGPMTTEELRRAIEEPARRGHWEFEPGLVELILRDVGDEPGALPLLSHALLETWKRRAGHTLTLKGYADAGGVHGAIAHTAESVYQTLSPEEQAITRDIFLRLTELGEGTEDTRRRASFFELTSTSENADLIRAVLNILADARLITLGEDTAEVAHEALIREWPTLREWLNQDREGLRLHRHLTEAAYEWELLGRDPGALYRGAHLSQAREWAALHPNALNAGEREFLATSINQEQREELEREEQQRRELEGAQKLAETERARAEEQTHSANRLRIRNRVITTVGVVALVLAVLAGVFGVQSNQHAQQAETNLTLADQQRAAAVNAQSTAVGESQIRATQQTIAETNFNRAEAQRLALEANRLILSQGNPEQIALLSLRSMNTHYTPEGDAALVAAAGLDYPQQLFTQPGNVTSVAYSPEGRYFLTGSNDGVARLWNVVTGELIRQFVGHTDSIGRMAFSPDGKFLLTGSSDKTTILWDTETGQEFHRFRHPDFVRDLDFSPDGKYMLITSFGGPLQLWDIQTMTEVRQFTGWYGNFSPDGKYAIIARDRVAGLWDVETGKELRQFFGHTSFVEPGDFSPDGKYVLTSSSDGTARLWDTATGEELRRFTEHTNVVHQAAFSKDGKFVFTSSDDGTTRLWDAQTGQEVRRFTCPEPSFVLSPTGEDLLTRCDDGMVRRWNITSSRELPSFVNNSVVNAVAFLPDGKFVLTGDSSGIARLWDATTGKKIRDFIGHTNVINFGAVFSPDGKHVLTGSWDNTVRLWDVQTGEEVRQFIGHTRGVNSVAFSPDGRSIASAGPDGTRLWDVETVQELSQYHIVDGSLEVLRVSFSPDGKYLVTANGVQGAAQLWDISTGELVRHFTGATGFMTSAAFLPDGKTILTGNDDGIARLWNVETGEAIREFIGHTDLIWTASFSPGGKYIATASGDSTARLWDTKTGQELRRFIGHTAGVANVAFSPDGKYILTGSDDGTAMLWDVDYHTTMEYLCSRLLRDFTDEERAQYGITDGTPTCPSKP